MTTGHPNSPYLTSVSFSDGIRFIGSYLNCTSLQSIDIPDSVVTLTAPGYYEGYAAGAFTNCISLTHAKLPAGAAVIPEKLFWNCVSLKSVTIPFGPETIKDGAFLNCTSLTSLTIPDSVKTIGAAFTNCSALKSIVLPAGLTELDEHAFDGCSSLEEITLPAGIHTWPVFKDCSSLKKSILPIQNSLQVKASRFILNIYLVWKAWR